MKFTKTIIKSYYSRYECNNYVKVGVPMYDKSSLVTCVSNMNKPRCFLKELFVPSGQTEATTATAKAVVSEMSSDFLNQLDLLQPRKSSNRLKKLDMPPFEYNNSLYYFHSNLQVQSISKLNFQLDLSKNSAPIMTPSGAIQSNLYTSM
jgi:hypothetical protein